MKENKIKLIGALLITLILSLTFIFYKMNDNKKNILISEKYIQAGLLLSANENEKSKKICDKSFPNFFSKINEITYERV